jgi:N-acetylglucosamine-6-phosphate deacetylase
VILVTDATRATGLPDGEVDLGGRTGHHGHGAVRLPDGTLAGSALTMEVALATFARASGWWWDRLWRASSGNAAASLGFEGKGSLVPGHDADLVLVDEDGTVQLTVAEGRVVYRFAK